MSAHTHRTPEFSLASREMLFVGFGEGFDANIRDFPYQDRTYYFEIVNDPDTALRWLEQRVDTFETYQLPHAIFCNLQWLWSDNFHFARKVKAHADLRYVPLIAFATQNESFDKEFLVRNGIDDCYTVPVNWQVLASRLDFLNQYKSKLVEQTDQVSPEPLHFQIPITKRLFDVVFAALGILLLSVVWLPVAVAIALESRGPVIYRSKRVGAGYQIFDFLKFRSMYVEADQQLCELQYLNQYGRNGSTRVFVKFARDPRVTRVGRFIRKYSLDELPQLINVLRGEMSLVGNRPLPLYEAEMLTCDEWSTRFLAPAGLTGLWQVTKRGHADMSAEERIGLDVAYARNHNIWTDLGIILKTFRAIVQKEEV